MPESGARRRAELLRDASARLAAAGLDEARERAELLWCRAASESRAQMMMGAAEAPAEADAARFAAWVERHARGEPLAYLEKCVGFYGLEFSVDPAVLIPRADSESVVESALDLLPAAAAGGIADLGTGSGCLLLSILHARPSCWGVGIDRSRAALEVARGNARQLGLQERAFFIQADWLESLRGPLTMLVANPPYVEPGEELGPGVAEYEPHAALFTPPGRPLEAYERILSRARAVLTPSGTLIFEVGHRRADAVAALAAHAGWQVLDRRKDLGGIERALAFRSLAAC
jgi:release factor glutamine methyltransferase